MLRHYDEIGLLVPERVDKHTSYRFYSAGQLSLANRIQALRDMGFSLSAIKEITSVYSDSDSLKKYLKIQHSQAKQEAEQAERRLQLLESALGRIGDENFMKHAVTAKEIPERHVASLRGVIPSYADESVLWEKMGDETKGLGMQIANPPLSLAVFHDEGYKESDVDVEIQVSVSGEYIDTENVRFRQIPAVFVASCVVKGSYDQLPGANEAIAIYVEENHYDFDGAMFCIYHVSPGHDANPDSWVTEVCFPVKKKLLP